MSQLPQNQQPHSHSFSTTGPYQQIGQLTLPDFLSKDEIELLKRTMLAEFAADQQESFVRICQRTRLDPFTKQLYATKRYVKVKVGPETRKVPTLVPVTGIMGLTAVAVRTGQYDGCKIYWAGKDSQWREEWLEPDPPEAAKCIVFHKQRTHPEVFIARWGSFVGQQFDYESKSWNITDFWARMPDFMLAKCAKAGALRGAFPDQLSNVYIREELESNVTEDDTETIDEEEQHYREAREKEARLIREATELKANKEAELAAQRHGTFVTPTKPPPDITPEQALEPALERDRIPEKPVQPAAKPAQDELDMSPPSAPWKEHTIKGIKKFFGRKLGSLNTMELKALETQWLPKARERWDDATDDQQADAKAIEAAVAFYKVERPF